MNSLFAQIILTVGVVMFAFYAWLAFSGKKAQSSIKAPIVTHRPFLNVGSTVFEIDTAEKINSDTDKFLITSTNGQTLVAYKPEIQPADPILTMMSANLPSGRAVWNYRAAPTDLKKLYEQAEAIRDMYLRELKKLQESRSDNYGAEPFNPREGIRTLADVGKQQEEPGEIRDQNDGPKRSTGKPHRKKGET